MEFNQLIDNQSFSPARIAAVLRTTQLEVADTLGLSRDALSHKRLVQSRKTQMRLREMVEILNRVEAQNGSLLAAYAWFRAEPLPGFGGVTPDQLVREGKAAQVHAYLNRIAAGGYA